MEFILAHTFINSFSKLKGNDQKQVKMTIFDLVTNPKSPNLESHQFKKGKDRNFKSIKASDNLRIILHKMNDSIMICYVDHHDEAYQWGENRKITEHPKESVTKVINTVKPVKKIVEPAVESSPPQPVEDDQVKVSVFALLFKKALLKRGVSDNRIADVLTATDEDSLLEITELLPTKVEEEIINLITGDKPEFPMLVEVNDSPALDYSDAQPPTVERGFNRKVIKRILLWCVPAVLWLVFTVWYTDFGGPLTEEEIAQTMTSLEQYGMSEERQAQFEQFFREDTGRQFLMVNNIDMNETPPSMPGFGPDATAQDYNDHYMEHMYPQLLSRASHPIFFADGLGIGVDVTGIEGAENWDFAALFRYKSRRALAEIISNPQTRQRHAYKHAAMSKTIAYPVEPGLYVSDLRIILFLVLGLITALVDIVCFGRRPINFGEK